MYVRIHNSRLGNAYDAGSNEMPYRAGAGVGAGGSGAGGVEASGLRSGARYGLPAGCVQMPSGTGNVRIPNPLAAGQPFAATDKLDFLCPEDMPLDNGGGERKTSALPSWLQGWTRSELAAGALAAIALAAVAVN